MSRRRTLSCEPNAAFRMAACLVVSMLLMGGAVQGRAREATPSPGIESTLRAAIHAGLCDNVGEVAFPLADLVYGLALLADVPQPTTPGPSQAVIVGPMEANAAAASTSVVPATIEELTRTPHSVNTMATVADPEPPRTCGEIGGVRAGDDLVFGLGALSPTAYAGTAWLHENKDGTTTVTLFLASGLSGDREPSPEVAAEATVPATAETTVAVPAEATGTDRTAEMPGVPVGTQTVSVEIDGGAFTTDDVIVRVGQPVVMHISNADNRAYRIEVLDLVDAMPVAANDTGVIEFTVPVPGTYVAQLLPVEGQEVLDTFSLTVVPPEEVLP